MKTSRYLTKSRFKIAYECPAKLYYHEQPDVFANKNRDNEFLQALAQGGFQVGALAKLYYPGGVDLESIKGSEDAIAQTKELLKQDKVTIYEAAIVHEGFLVRVDVLAKDGPKVSLFEVKSKSIDPTTHEGFFLQDKKGLNSKWEEYLVDVGFQTWVLTQAYPQWQVTPNLILADKSTVASVDGIHQHFRLVTSDRRHCAVEVKEGLRQEDLGARLLATVDVSREVKFVIEDHVFPRNLKLPEYARYLADCMVKGERGESRHSSLCGPCEFRTTPEPGQKSGFVDCWSAGGKLRPTDLNRPMIFEIWNCRQIPRLLSANKVFFDELTEEDLKPKKKSSSQRKLAPADRQWIQVEKSLSGDETPYVDSEGLRELFAGVSYPFHCIDFETTMVAIPFHKGRRPYEQIAFQFSHHVLHEDGRVEHRDQFIDMRRGVFPNFEFVRRLKKSLVGDQGSIFRYATHENTVLRQIRRQLQDSEESDREELIQFIEQITKPSGHEEGRAGSRCMIDLREVVLDHFYHPIMGGSNSIKKVVPAVLQDSQLLRQKYCAPTYGRDCEIKSLNFDRWKWIELDGQGRVLDPYGRLPPVFTDLERALFDGESPIFKDDSIDDGGAAMTAWSRMQFTEMSDRERVAIEAALLKYCELDTLSMVWLLEFFSSLANVPQGEK
jgi:hypothetical protein